LNCRQLFVDRRIVDDPIPDFLLAIAIDPYSTKRLFSLSFKVDTKQPFPSLVIID
jgi:hypothetical protein